MDKKELKKMNFWNSVAGKYDKFVSVYTKSYKKSLELIKSELNPNDKVLEIGAGTGIISFEIAGYVQGITALDYASGMIEIAKAKQHKLKIGNITFKNGHATQLDQPDNTFDIVIASNIFHLISEADKALWEIHRVLKNEGKAILPTYCHGENIKTLIISLLMGISGFRAENKWSTKSFKGFVENEGFTVLKETIIPDKIPLSFIVAKKNK